MLSIAIKSLNDAIGKYGAKSENSYVNVVYDESDNPIAFDMFTFDEDGQRASSHIVVGIESQGKGIGSQLLDKRHEHLKELGFKSYEIWGMSEQFENLLKKNEIKYKRNIDEDTITIFIED